MIFAIKHMMIFLLGTILASTVICLQDRGWGKHKSIYARSACPNCQKGLNFLELIPIIGWLKNYGRCQHCGIPLSLIYPVSELFGGVWAIGGSQSIDTTLSTVVWSAVGVMCLLILYHDITDKRIPNLLSLGVGIIGMTWHGEYLTALLLGIIAVSVRWLFNSIRNQEVLGLGDIKLMVALGLWLPLPGLSSFLIVAGAFGLLWGRIWKYRYHQPDFPFAPALLFSFIVLFLFRVARFAKSGILSLDSI
jgi:leader peptidase (prepilin peptidase)/N-methyltransferase